MGFLPFNQDCSVSGKPLTVCIDITKDGRVHNGPKEICCVGMPRATLWEGCSGLPARLSLPLSAPVLSWDSLASQTSYIQERADVLELGKPVESPLLIV